MTSENGDFLHQLAEDTYILRSVTTSKLLAATHQHQLNELQDKANQERDLLSNFVIETTKKLTSAVVINGEKSSPPRSRRTLSTLIDAYSEDSILTKRWTAKTAQENKAIFALLLRIVGDIDISNYDKEVHGVYRNTLLKLPKNINKDPRYIGKSIQQIIDSDPNRASITTTAKQLQRVSALLGWAVNHGHITSNPATGTAIHIKKNPSDERRVFSNDDLTKLFNSSEFGGAKQSAYQYWMPLIALFSGARLNEIAQLEIVDFKVVDGIDVMSVNNDGDNKRIKSHAGIRLIPLHEELIRLGILDYVSDLAQKGHPRLFPELSKQRDGYGAAASKWFARYRKRCGITEQGKVFHSFRHTVANQLKQSGTSIEKVAAIMGHVDESETFGRYGKTYHPSVLAVVINTLSYPVFINARLKK